MSPPTVNAYYNPQNNEIVFPAGILQPPFFDPDADDALNYGGMGSVIGHEMTHGFDDQGSKFDPTGNMANWWTDADLKAFKDRAQCIINQFSGFEVEKGLNLNGSLVQGESIADLGGLVIAYAAFQKSLGTSAQNRVSGNLPVVDNLSHREMHVFLLLGSGLGTKKIAHSLRLRMKTIETHRENIKTKLKLENSTALNAEAVRWTLENQ